MALQTAAKGNPTTGQVSVSTTAQAVAANSVRRGCDLKNTHASTIIYVGTTGVTTSNGFPIGPGESYTWKSVGAIHAVASTGSATLAYADYQD